MSVFSSFAFSFDHTNFLMNLGVRSKWTRQRRRKPECEAASDRLKRLRRTATTREARRNGLCDVAVMLGDAQREINCTPLQQKYSEKSMIHLLFQRQLL